METITTYGVGPDQPTYNQLREQNRVLRSNLVNCVARLEAYYGEDYPAVRDAKAALTPQAGKGGGE